MSIINLWKGSDILATLSVIAVVSQIVFTMVVGMYFLGALKTQKSGDAVKIIDSKKDLENLKKLRDIKLSEPLSEKTRPKLLKQVVGQEDGIKGLRAALCGKNPQHVLIYGPPGVGKTAAARLMLKEAAYTNGSPFQENSKFVEVDATTIRFDERSIADPLIGSVHDPIYQGAGAYGQAGIPQPKEGCVTKAHGGVLFIDEIGELHPMQMNKLLKVLEDRKVFLSSAYYSSENKNIPKYIHEVFQNGLPADFRLVGATTRSPEEIPPAIRSRCTEIYFKPLNKEHIKRITEVATKSTGMECDVCASEKVTLYASNGREAVNMVQTAASLATMENRTNITQKDIEWVAQAGRYSSNIDFKVTDKIEVGTVNALAVFGSEGGTVLQIECWAQRGEKGTLKVTGIVEEEEFKNGAQTMKKHSSASASVENVTTALSKEFGINIQDYDIHLNFPGGIPIDGPSAGIAMFSAIYSAVTKKVLAPKIAMTGEVSINGEILPVGGVARKIEAAINAGIKKVIIPYKNYQSNFDSYDIEIATVKTLKEIVDNYFLEDKHEMTA